MEVAHVSFFIMPTLSPTIRRTLKTLIPRPLRRAIRSIVAEVDEVEIVMELLRPIGRQTVMIDVGAHVGDSLAPVADGGGTVFAFEPDPGNRAKLVQRFGNRRNVVIDPRAIGAENRKGVAFFTSSTSTGISGLSAFEEKHAQTGVVDVVTLADALPAMNRVDLLKIDTEGFDLFALQGMPWARCKPRFVVCEFEDRKTRPLGHEYHALAKLLTSQGYVVIISEWYPIERYGVAHQWRRFTEYPSSLANPDAWGNLIACHDVDADSLRRHIQRRARVHRLTGAIRRSLR